MHPKSNPQNQTEPIRIKVTASGTKPGLFQGLMIIREGKNTTHMSIPLTFASNTFNWYIYFIYFLGIYKSESKETY
jgi:hypothetical protein